MRKIALSLTLHYVGLPYIWGGDDAIAGFDCSGFVQEPLKSTGKLPRKGDRNAEGIYLYYKNLGKEVQSPRMGCLIFYAKNNKINHVEIYWKRGLTIGASGGGSATLTREDAIKHNAYIKVRPMRKNVFAIVDPFKQ